MKDPVYPLLHSGGYTNWVSLDVFETEHGVKVGPAPFPVKGLSICCGIIFAMSVGMAAVIWYAEKQKPAVWAAAPIGIGLLTVTGVWLLVWFQFRREAQRGPVFIADKKAGKFQCPRANIEGDLDQLKEVVLVDGRMPFRGSPVMELQMLVKKKGQNYCNILLAHCLGGGLLDEMHRKLAAALRLPATKATD